MSLHCHHINFPLVLRIIGLLLMIEAGFMLIPLATSVVYAETDCSMAFLWSAVITFVCGAGLYKVPIKTTQMRRREGFLLTSVVWVFFSAFSMIPFCVTGVLPSITDAFLSRCRDSPPQA